jgi:type IV pilus assembly protein PilN
MRVPVNLASQPLENLRPLRAGVIVAALTAVIFGAIVLRNEMRNRSEFSALIDQRNRLEASLATLRKEQQELDSWLRTPEALQIRERSAFLNSLILRKSLSWTQMFMDLEKTLPSRVRIASIRPSLTGSDGAKLGLTAMADSMGPLVDFLKNLETSPKFGPPAVAAQKQSARALDESGITIDLTTEYRQDRAALSTASSKVTKPGDGMPTPETEPHTKPHVEEHSTEASAMEASQ